MGLTRHVGSEALARGLAEILVFELADQRYGLPGSSVRELVRAVSITPLPRQPEFVEGVINLRGRIVPVLDVRSWLGLPARGIEPSDHFLVATVGSRLVALRVDRALELVPLEEGVLAQAEAWTGTPSVTRVAKLAGGLVLIPNLEAFLTGSALERLDETVAATPLVPGDKP